MVEFPVVRTMTPAAPTRTHAATAVTSVGAAARRPTALEYQVGYLLAGTRRSETQRALASVLSSLRPGRPRLASRALGPPPGLLAGGRVRVIPQGGFW